MNSYLLVAASALILAMGGTPLARRVALRYGVIAMPNARNIHLNPVPMMGGAAIYVAFILVLVLFGNRYFVNQSVGIFIGATLISLMGVVDDRWGLGSYIKLAGQFAAAGILIFSGVQVQLFGSWIDVAITLLWVVGITNAMNLLDNMDGLSGGVAMIAAIFFALLAAMSNQILVAPLAAALAGACAGFLIHNWNPAHVFMGDTGSLFIGFVLAAIGIKLRFPLNTDDITWMIPLLVLAVPVFDTTLVFVSRLRRGKNPLTTPGKDHISHRLSRLLGSKREAVLICYLLGGATGLLAIYATEANRIEAAVVGLGVAAVAVYGIWWLEFRRGGV